MVETSFSSLIHVQYFVEDYEHFKDIIGQCKRRNDKRFVSLESVVAISWQGIGASFFPNPLPSLLLSLLSNTVSFLFVFSLFENI